MLEAREWKTLIDALINNSDLEYTITLTENSESKDPDLVIESDLDTLNVIKGKLDAVLESPQNFQTIVFKKMIENSFYNSHTVCALV